MKPRIYRLSEAKPRCRRVLSAAATPPLSGKQTSWVTITRTGSFTDPRYGPFEITSPMLLSMVKNFDEQVVGQEIYIDVNHKPGDGAAAKILKLRVEGTRLRALAEWTDYGLKAVRERGFTYLSAEFADNWQDNEGGAFHGPTLLGAGLTVRPVIKRLDPITLSCESGGDTLILAELADDLMKKARANMDKLKEFLKKLAESGYSAKVQAQVKKLAEAAVDENTGEEKAAAVIAELEGMAKTLAAAEDEGKKAAAPAAAATPAAPTAAPAQAAAPAKTLSEDELEALVAKKLAEAEQAKAQQAQAREANEKLLAEEIGKAEGLSDELKKELDDTSLSSLEAKWTVDYYRYQVRARIALRFPRHKLVNDGTNIGPGQKFVTPQMISDEITALERDLEEMGIVEDVDIPPHRPHQTSRRRFSGSPSCRCCRQRFSPAPISHYPVA